MLAGRIMVEGAKSSGSMSEGSESRSESDTSSIRALRDILVDVDGVVTDGGLGEGEKDRVCVFGSSLLSIKVCSHNTKDGTSYFLRFLCMYLQDLIIPKCFEWQVTIRKSNPHGYISLRRDLLKVRPTTITGLSMQC